MGSIIRPLLIAAPLLLAAPVHAQQAQESPPGFQLPPASTTPAPNPNQQGPELNVYRDPAIPRATPPVVTPPAVVPTVTPPSTTVQPTPQPSRPSQTPAQPREPRPTERATPPPSPAPSTPSPTAPSAQAPAATEPSNGIAPQPQPLPTPAPNATDMSEPTAPPPAAAEESDTTPWLIGGAIALIALMAVFLLRRRRRSALSLVEDTAAPVARPAPPIPAADALPPAPEQGAPLHTPTPAPTATRDRPWLDMDMAVAQARYSLMGVTISYRLILHNRGDRPAQDVLVRGMLGNGGAQQQAVLQGFFTGQDGLPLHSAVGIAPGETVQLTGELRLSPDQIVPVAMGQRSLLIPLAAFDTAYRWGADEGEPNGQPEGQGRTARAFIVGQEQEPPAERLAPLRLDQGPRQYRRPAARAAAELTPA